MLCQEFEVVLEQWPPESLPPEAAAHVGACTHCQALMADLEAIQQAGARLGQEDRQLVPPEHVWLAVRSQLEAEGLVREPEHVHAGFFTAWLGAIPRPALAGACLALILAAAGFVVKTYWNPAAPAPVPLDRAAVGIETQLNVAEQGTIQALPQSDPDLAADVRHDLEVVDKFISLCEKNVREDPQNQLAREYLYDAYQQKAGLLSAMMERGETGD